MLGWDCDCVCSVVEQVYMLFYLVDLLKISCVDIKLQCLIQTACNLLKRRHILAFSQDL
jgi:hypothetical protein